MARYVYVGNKNADDGTSRIIFTSTTGEKKQVRIGQSVDMTPEDVLALDALYFFQPGEGPPAAPYTLRLDLVDAPRSEGDYVRWIGGVWRPSTGGVGGDVTPTASTTAKGLVRVSSAPTDPTTPIAVETNDSRMTNARTPTAHTHPQADVTGLTTDLSALATAVNARVVKDSTCLNVKDYGATGDGSTDDRGAIQSAIDAAAGKPVYFPATGSGYLINGPLVAKRGTHLIGAQRPAYFPGVWRPTYIFAGAGFSGAALVTASDSTSPLPSGGSIEGLTLYCSFLTGVDGARWTGFATDWLVRDVEVMALGVNAAGFRATGNGAASPSQEIVWENCFAFSDVNSPRSGSVGWVLQDRAYDHMLRSCVAHHLGSDGFLLTGSSTRLVASVEFDHCRAEWNGGRGWGMNTGDKVTLRGCTTDRNSGHGFEVIAGVLGRPLVLSDCYFNRDGRGGSGVGLAVTNTAIVIASNLTVARGTDDGSSANPGPAVGVQVSGVGSILLADGYFGGTGSSVFVSSGSLKYRATTVLDTNGVISYQAATT